MRRILLSALLLGGMMAAIAQVKKDDLKTGNKKSPEAETSVTVNGKDIWVFYHAPSVNKRKIFGGKDALQPDGTVWRLGADYATVLHTDADLTINDLKVPKGDYTLYVESGWRSVETDREQNLDGRRPSHLGRQEGWQHHQRSRH